MPGTSSISQKYCPLRSTGGLAGIMSLSDPRHLLETVYPGVPFTAYCLFLWPLPSSVSVCLARQKPQHSSSNLCHHGFPCRKWAQSLLSGHVVPGPASLGFLLFCPTSSASAVFLARQVHTALRKGHQEHSQTM